MYSRISLFIFLALLLSTGFLAGCEHDVTAPAGSMDDHADGQPEALSRAAMSYEDGVTRYDGVIGGTNLYAIFVPDDWNGDLVTYAHGFIDVASSLDLPSNDRIDEIRGLLLADGYAFAYSSYRENGFAVQSGGWATQKLSTLFRSLVKAHPEHTWLVGHSLGGLVTLEMAEKAPGDYDGILSLAGVTGGSAMQLDYVANVRLLFDFFYPGLFPGDVLNVPAGITQQQVQDIVTAALVQDGGQGIYLISQLDQTPLPSPTQAAMVGSLIYALMWNVRGIEDVLERTRGETPIDNMDTVYTSSSGTVPPSLLNAINATIPRYDRTDGADAEMRRNYEPTGRLGIPMVAVHNFYDPAVPYFHAADYNQAVNAMGLGDRFELVSVPAYGHSSFDPQVVHSAFQSLVNKATSTLDSPVATF